MVSNQFNDEVFSAPNTQQSEFPFFSLNAHKIINIKLVDASKLTKIIFIKINPTGKNYQKTVF